MNIAQNHTELNVLIHEYEAMLQPCAHCGHERPGIEYSYHPNKVIVPGKKHPHGVRVNCSCKTQTDVVHAEDDPDRVDIKEALRMVVAIWNKLPDMPDDPAITEMYSEKYYEFKNQEEAKEYFESRGKPYDKDTIYLGILFEAKE